MKKSQKNSKSIINPWEIIIIIGLFILFSYLTRNNIKTFHELVGKSIAGMVIYVFVFIMAVVIAPINSEPLIPVASQIWGWITAAILTLIGWSIGSLIAFLIARRYGKTFIKKFVSLNKMENLQKLMPEKNIFWGIVLLRMTIQVDILSYIIGIFSTISAKKYLLATILGLIPMALALAYIGEMPLFYQLLALSTALLLLLFSLLIALKRKRSDKKL